MARPGELASGLSEQQVDQLVYLLELVSLFGWELLGAQLARILHLVR